MSKFKNTENFIVLALFLGVTGLISALVLAWVSGLTAKPIDAAKSRRLAASLREVIGTTAFDNDPARCRAKVESPLKDDTVEFYGVKNHGRLAAVVGGGTEASGYAGPISALVGMTPEGKIIAVVVTEQGETPGLGAEVCTRKFQRTIFNLAQKPEGLAPNSVLDQFDHRTAVLSSPWRVVADGGEIVGRTGATVTSRAVTKLVWKIAAAYVGNREAVTAQLDKEN